MMTVQGTAVKLAEAGMCQAALGEAAKAQRKAENPPARKARGKVRRQDYLVIALGLIGLAVAKLVA